MLYAIYSKTLGQVILHLDTIRISGFHTYVTGYDDDHNPIRFVMDRFNYLEDYYSSYGYCHMISYTKNGVTTPCSEYYALS